MLARIPLFVCTGLSFSGVIFFALIGNGFDMIYFIERVYACVAEKSGIASAGAGTTVRVCMGFSLPTIQSWPLGRSAGSVGNQIP